MTFAEARAQFPVLTHYAYLNAGTSGPLARATVEALVAEAERELRTGRSGQAYIDRILERREEARRSLAAVLDVDPAHVALVESTTRGCAVVLAGLGLGAGGQHAGGGVARAGPGCAPVEYANRRSPRC